MKTKILFLLGVFFWASSALAEDVDIYGISDIDLKPNVLIILDNSGSMSNKDVAGNSYVETDTYTGTYTCDAVYVQEDIYTEVCNTRTYWDEEYTWVDGYYEEVCRNRRECTEWNWRGRCTNYEWTEVCEDVWRDGHYERQWVEKTEEVCHSEKTGTQWTLYFDDVTSSDWKCDSAEEELLSEGHWYGKLRESGGVVNCSGSGSSSDYAMGNYLNFLAAGGTEDEYRSRMEVAKEVVAELIYDNIDTVNVGLMAFNESKSGGSPYSDDYANGGYIIAECGSTLATLIGDYDPETDSMSDSAQSSFGAVGLLKSDTYTPLAEALGEAGLYLAGEPSWFNSTNASYPLGHYSSSCTDSNSSCLDYSAYSPIEYRCQKSYIILVTDGAPTRDDDKFANFNYILGEKLTESSSDDNSSYLDDVADFLQNNDIRSDLGETGDFKNQTVTTYTIGFTDGVDANLLTSTANRGGGDYYQATSAAQLNQALNNIIADISTQKGLFTAAAVPVSQANKAYAGNYIYYGLFQPTNSGNWYGNLKKYALTDSGVIQDKNGNDIESGGTIIDNAVSFWSEDPDGSSVTEGGAGEVLLNRTTDRNIYTYTATLSGTEPITDLTDTSNLFVTENTALTDGTYTGLDTDVITAVRTGVAEDWPLGSLLHSQPLVVHYDTDDDGDDDYSTIFAGANDGMLHCFDDTAGTELWGFIPQDLLENLSVLESPTSLEYFVDGTPVYYHYDHDGNDDTADKKMIIFGERRGGSGYTALDISDYSAPEFKYSISSDILGTGNEQLGQSWAEPQSLTMGYTYDSTYYTKDVFLMAGGYDINQDLDTPLATDSMGRAVYAVDAQTGDLFDYFRFSNDTYSAMTHSTIAVAGFENPNSRTTTRVYAGDMNGNLFAFRDDVFDYDTDDDYQEDGVWGQQLKLFAATGQKIWYAPNIVSEYFPVELTYDDDGVETTTTQNRIGDYVFFGTGDRAHPKRTDILNGFYAIKNNWQWLDDDGNALESPTIVEAYVDDDDGGKVKAKSDDHTIVDGESDSGEWFILDVTDDLYQSGGEDYVTFAIDHENNRGWFFLLQEADESQVGEKVVSTPLIYNGVIYFSTYIPDNEEDDEDDPCEVSGAEGSGYLYAIGYEYGGAAIDFDEDDDVDQNDRRKKLESEGIPPEPVLVVQVDGSTIVEGFETLTPVTPAGLETLYWRQLEREL